MKVAVISDVHGNIVALEAVISDIRKRKADTIICLGDMIGKGPSSKESVDLCRKECDTVIKGNWDIYIYLKHLELKQGKTGGVSKRAMWYINDIGSERLEYLGSLPHSTELYISGKLIRLFHAHPQNFNRYYSYSPIEKKSELFGYNDSSTYKKTADAAIYADIHEAYMQIIENKCLINTGSVGNPLDMTQASYVMLEGEEGNESSFSAQFIRVPYDIEKAVNLAIKADIPDLDGYITELRTAVYFYRGNVL